MIEELEELAVQAIQDLGIVSTQNALDSWRVKFLGKKSRLMQVLSSLPALKIEERRFLGSRINDIKNQFETALTNKNSILSEASVNASLKAQVLDVTLPGYPLPLGRLHPITKTLQEICGIFSGMGFDIVEGPEVEWDYYNFEALNIPEDHPSRDTMATFWLNKDSTKTGKNMLLRTHTSPMQIRIMEKTKPPLRVVVPGRVYRYEATDATHDSMFNQVEGLAVDRHITLSDLKGTLFEFASLLFGKDRKVRFRCDYFPFVEPGVEMAIDCGACHGNGCRLCGGNGWMEILGAGMVHPDVLRRVKIDPEEYSGFAFGMGVERIPILRYGIDDIRHFCGNDLRFLRQF